LISTKNILSEMPGPLPVLFTHYGEDWIRGSETLLLDLLRALDKDKIQPIVWCNSTAMANASRDAGYVTYQDEFQYMFDYGSPKPSAREYLRLITKCRALCRKHNIRVLHSNSLAPTQWLGPAGALESIPVLSHLHIDYLRRSRYALLLHSATLVVGVSRQVVEGPLEDGMKPSRVRVIYNGIDFSRLIDSKEDLRSALGIPREAFVIATTGSLIARKGHDILIRAFHALPSTPVLPHLIIPSSGPELTALRELAAALGVQHRVHFLGYIDDVVQVYKAADVFALASRGDAFGLALAEAGHFGVPAVSTRVGGIPEVVLQDETGLLTGPDDVAAFSKALARMMTDHELRARLGEAARKRVGAVFTAASMARQFEDAYAELAAMPSKELSLMKSTGRLFGPYAKLLRLRRPPLKPRYAA
jgi:glycosyltransferase involved in cell wall biosynthesis